MIGDWRVSAHNNRMKELLALLGRSPLGPLALGLAYLGLSSASLALSRGSDGGAIIWGPSGLLLATLLVVPRNRLWWFIGAAAFASMASNMGAGFAPLLAAGFTLANMLEALIATLIVRRRNGSRVSFVDPAGLGRFFVASLIGSAISAAVAALANAPWSMQFASSWFATVWLGMLIVAPLLVTLVELAIDRRRNTGSYAIVDLIVVLLLTTGISVGTFFQNSYPIFFLPVIVLLIGVLRCGALGAVFGMIVVSSIGSLALSLGSGPLTLMPATHDSKVLFFQCYLLALFASTLPMAALLAGRDRLRVDLAERIRLLSLAEETAHIGHWRIDVAKKKIFWSPEIFRIHGLEPGLAPTMEGALNGYHVDDRETVATIVRTALSSGGPFEFSARLVWPDGTIRHVFSRGERDLSPADDAVALFGLLQDVTDQTEARRILQEARDAAERAERNAVALAETDVLTGLANRRKIIQQLQTELGIARRDGSALAVAIFDIDHFKAVNDLYGHAVGDDVLRRVAQTAGGALRGTDRIGRYGGEEFVLVLPQASPEIAARIAERVRVAVEQDGVTTDQPSVTISLGVASFRGEPSAEEILERADIALYEAKNGGRNKYRLAV